MSFSVVFLLEVEVAATDLDRLGLNMLVICLIGVEVEVPEKIETNCNNNHIKFYLTMYIYQLFYVSFNHKHMV